MDEVASAEATQETLTALHDLLARFWVTVERSPVPPLPGDLRVRFATAVIEIAGNITTQQNRTWSV